MTRVRHHTNDPGLDGIQDVVAINPSRGWMPIPFGIHVEVEPFGTTRPYRIGRSCPKNDLGLRENGAYVEFDAPPDMPLYRYSCGPRNTALIPTVRPLPLLGLNAEYVKVRRRFWEFWRKRPE